MSDSLLEEIGSNLSFGGQQLRYRHHSNILNCDMTFSIYLPPQAKQAPKPVLYWLSGLTCTDENFVTKAGAQQYAAEYGVAIVCPDTSPRGEGVPDDEEGSYDFGLGAGFYVNATEEPWATHYQMYDYVVEELPALINAEFPVDGSKVAISGHSMGGHGALLLGFKFPSKFVSVSALSPVCAASESAWGQAAYTEYFGDDQSLWTQADASKMIEKVGQQYSSILVDQGGDDNFLAEGQLQTSKLQAACEKAKQPLTLRYQAGHDHSYYFIQTVINEHIEHHWHMAQLI